MTEFDKRVRSLLAEGETGAAATLVLRELGPEIVGFLSGVLGDTDADEVFSALSERLWRSLSGFEGRCSIRTWSYVLARHEIGRFRKGMRRHADGRVPISELADLLAVARTRSRSTMATDKGRKLALLRDALPVEDRTLLILRVDRGLAWDEIALAFAETPESFGEDDRKREAARLRKRFQLIKERLVARARAIAAT
jgi:RNA polymerase sigma-70 factor (ECF subfamily)